MPLYYKLLYINNIISKACPDHFYQVYTNIHTFVKIWIFPASLFFFCKIEYQIPAVKKICYNAFTMRRFTLHWYHILSMSLIIELSIYDIRLPFNHVIHLWKKTWVLVVPSNYSGSRYQKDLPDYLTIFCLSLIQKQSSLRSRSTHILHVFLCPHHCTVKITLRIDI